jgi:choline transport protein
MMKQEIQSSDKQVWKDIETNTKIMSDDDALLNSTGKVGELKRYDFVL